MFKTLARLFAATPAAAKPAPKTTLGVSVLEARDCPAVLTHDLTAAVAPHAPDAGHQPAHTSLARMSRPSLNPQPLPP